MLPSKHYDSINVAGMNEACIPVFIDAVKDVLARYPAGAAVKAAL
jgi:hypothetical protein